MRAMNSTEMTSPNKLLLLFSNPLISGASCGLLHHVFVQYPCQKPLFYTLRAMALANAVFTGVFLTHDGIPGTSPTEWLDKLTALLVYNLTFVKQM
jgi:hypothetical protein